MQFLEFICRFTRWRSFRQLACLATLLALPHLAQAIPVFARQTGQRCVACHAGGQFPELTPYGRLFKMTGYTIGERTSVPLAVMAIASYTKTSNTRSETPSVDFPKDAIALFQTGSVFAGGKITNNLGLFAQVTYDNYAEQDPVSLRWKGHSQADNIDLRYADRWINGTSDWIAGLSLNNNPSVSDVWNTAPAWIEYVPTNFGFTGPAASPLIAQLGQQVAGLTAYTWWNRSLYGEAGLYRAATRRFSWLISGNTIETRLKGTAPYFRFTASHEWGPHNAMIGLIGLNASVHADPMDLTSPATRYRDRGIDAQYQYLLDPHVATAQFSYIRERIRDGDLSGATARPAVNLRQWRLKASYVYRAQAGASLSYFSTTGTPDSTLYPGSQDDGAGGSAPIPITGSAMNNPGTRGWVPEVFWIPLQNLRIGAQYTRFTRYNGARTNYDGALRNAADNNTLFVYAWVAF